MGAHCAGVATGVVVATGVATNRSSSSSTEDFAHERVAGPLTLDRVQAGKRMHDDPHLSTRVYFCVLLQDVQASIAHYDIEAILERHGDQGVHVDS